MVANIGNQEEAKGVRKGVRIKKVATNECYNFLIFNVNLKGLEPPTS